jgi:hypothetical protein
MVGVAVAVLAAAAAPASGAPLVVSPATLFVQSGPATIDVPIRYARFGGAGAIVTGTPLDVGGTWTVGGGTWTRLSGAADLVSGTGRSHLWVDSGRADHEVRVTVVPQNSASSRRGGVVLRGSATTTYLQVLYRHTSPAGRVELQKVAPTGVTTLAAVSLPGTSRPSSIRLAARATGPSVQVRIAGTLVLTHTLTGGDAGTYGSGSRTGITTDGDGRTSLDELEVWR